MSPDGQKALIAGGCTAYGCEHFKMHRCPQDYPIIPLPDLFELDLNTTCWVQAGLQHPKSPVLANANPCSVPSLLAPHSCDFSATEYPNRQRCTDGVWPALAQNIFVLARNSLQQQLLDKPVLPFNMVLGQISQSVRYSSDAHPVFVDRAKREKMDQCIQELRRRLPEEQPHRPVRACSLPKVSAP